MEASVDCVLGLGAGQIEPRAAQAIFGRRCGRRDFLRQSFVAVGEPGPADGSLDAGRNHVGQCTLIVDGHFRVLYAQRFEHVTSLGKNRFSIIRTDAGFEAEFDAARVARFDGDVEVGADIFSRMSSFGGFSIGGHKKTTPQTTRRTLRSTYVKAIALRVFVSTLVPQSFARMASVICTVEAAPWLIDFAPPEMRIMS